MSEFSKDVAEYEPQHRRVRFEPGIHGYDISYEEAIGPILKGDFSHSVWSNAAAERLAQQQPTSLAIDGLTSVVTYGEMSREQKAATLSLIPGTPKTFNENGEMFAVAADATLYGYDIYSAQEQSLRLAYGAATVFGSLAIGGVADRILHTKANRGNKYMRPLHERDKHGPISRRQFIARTAAYGAVTLLTAPTLAPLSSNDQIRHFGKTVAEVGEPIRSIAYPERMNTFIDGRTALLIEKSVSLPPDKLPSNQTAVLMGSSHTFNAMQLETDRNLRFEKIRALAELIRRDIDESTTNQEERDDAIVSAAYELSVSGILLIRKARNPDMSVDETIEHMVQKHDEYVHEPILEIVRQELYN